MKDTVNGAYKIGMSKKPHYREKTLQSEKPFVELVEAWESTASMEKFLHKVLDKQRIRGEWFRLNSYHLALIYEKMSCYCKLSDGNSDGENRFEREVKRGQRPYFFSDNADCVDVMIEELGENFCG